ncbi:MAG: hemolysin family protein [Candidatus Sumerlaeaceae bacterium]
MVEPISSAAFATAAGAVAHVTAIGEDVLRVFFIIFLIVLNGFFVAAEFAIVKVRGTKLQALADRGSRRAKMAQHVLENLDEYLSACQLGITIASIVLGAVGEHFMRARVVEPLLGHLPFISDKVASAIAFILGTGIIVFLHVVLGEQAPKYVAIQRSEPTALWCAYPLKWFFLILYPFIVVLNTSANWLLRLVGIDDPGGHDVPHSEDELRMIVAESQRTGNLTRDKLDLLENIFDFSNVLVRQIMVPRTEVAVFDLRRPLGENLGTAERTAHSRYPLVDGDIDHVVGVIHMKDLFWQLKDMELSPQAAGEAAERRNPMIAGGDIASRPPSTGAQFLTAIAREALYVPETARINTLLREFQSKRIHMAMVVDEYGGVTGLVTFENVIEEIVGEVQDEFDQEVPRIKQVSEREFMLDGATTLDEVNDAADLELESDEADTIGGYVLSLLGKIPKPGDKVMAPGVELMVREMRRQRIHRVSARVLTPEEIEAANEKPVEDELSGNSTEF